MSDLIACTPSPWCRSRCGVAEVVHHAVVGVLVARTSPSAVYPTCVAPRSVLLAAGSSRPTQSP
eukprot:7619331-Pyramimonas_sp.AAC.1